MSTVLRIFIVACMLFFLGRVFQTEIEEYAGITFSGVEQSEVKSP